MSNGFTDFFETLLPREITVYVIPGSVVLGTILWHYNFYNRLVNCKLDSATYMFDKVIGNPNAATYTISTIIWATIAYTIGLIIGGIKEGILYKCIKNYARVWKCFFDARWGKKWTIITIIFSLLKNKNKPRKRRTNNYQKSHYSAMYISLYQKTMYRREIERYGVFANSLDNLTIALGFVIWFIITKPLDSYFTEKDKIFIAIISFFVLLLLPIGAEGYRKLQRDRIRYLKEATDNIAILENMRYNGEQIDK